jgi:hypothetical protein
MSLRFGLIALAITTLVAGCATENIYVPPAGQKVRITKRIMDFFKDYQAEINSTQSGVFALSESGGAAGYAYCPESRCLQVPSAGQLALKDCTSSGERCFIFANGNAIKYDYVVVP